MGRGRSRSLPFLPVHRKRVNAGGKTPHTIRRREIYLHRLDLHAEFLELQRRFLDLRFVGGVCEIVAILCCAFG